MSCSQPCHAPSHVMLPAMSCSQPCHAPSHVMLPLMLPLTREPVPTCMRQLVRALHVEHASRARKSHSAQQSAAQGWPGMARDSVLLSCFPARAQEPRPGGVWALRCRVLVGWLARAGRRRSSEPPTRRRSSYGASSVSAPSTEHAAQRPCLYLCYARSAHAICVNTELGLLVKWLPLTVGDLATAAIARHRTSQCQRGWAPLRTRADNHEMTSIWLYEFSTGVLSAGRCPAREPPRTADGHSPHGRVE